MRSVFKPVRSPFSTGSIERILSRYYARLVEWSGILTRGVHTAAEEIVQDLCLHLTVARPDLSAVSDLDAYLYTCLRNMYISRLAQVSRERLRVIQVEDYDEVGMAVSGSGADSVDVQNDLIRICDYVLSRKYSSKSASHFILHFFFGYRRSDVALLARLPIAAIYNKLKGIRSELRETLSSTASIRIVPRGTPPERELLRTALSSDSFMKELRSIVLNADSTECVNEESLVNPYKQPGAPPVGCRELAHLAGCERCLGILERALRLDDREGPLDGLEADRAPKAEGRRSFDATMRLVHRRREQLFERRPALLAIAVDGRVVAFHAVESSHNSLSSRVELASTVRFIEVFDEFGDRLAHIPLDEASAHSPMDAFSQQILLSDNRRLRLDIRFDGLGIHAQADYIDPFLAPSAAMEVPPDSPKAAASLWTRLSRPAQIPFAPWGMIAFASILLAVSAGIAGYRYMHPGWRDVVARSQAAAEVPLPTQTIHQVLRIEEAAGPENGAVLGAIDIWRSGDGRVVRRIYNSRQQLIATSSESGDGEFQEHVEGNAPLTEKDRHILESGVWQSDVSSAALDTRQGAVAEAFRGSSGFEVTQREDGHSGILSRTLVMDRNYRVEAERVRFRTANGVSEVRLVQTLLRRVPNRDVPASTFPRPEEMKAPGMHGESNLPIVPGASLSGDANSANLQVAVLFALFQLKADIGQPIEVSPIQGGRIRLTGTVTDAQLLAKIRESAAALPYGNRVDFEVRSVKEAASAIHRGKQSSQELVGTGGDAPAAGLVRDAFIARGLKGAALKSAEQEFAASALTHAQAALQHASALDRLGLVLRQAGRSSLNPDARGKWAQMVDRHSAAVVAELRALHLQLDSISAGLAEIPSGDTRGIADASAFVLAASELRMRTQSVNREVVELFAGSAANLPPAQAQQSIAHMRAELPFAEASRVSSFANRLAGRNAPSQSDLGEMPPR